MKDLTGNDLDLGDLVQVTQPHGDTVLGRVIDHNPGRISTVGVDRRSGKSVQQVQPETIEVSVTIRVSLDDPTGRASTVVKVFEPDSKIRDEYATQIKARKQKSSRLIL